jgi:hypothetical protein
VSVTVDPSLTVVPELGLWVDTNDESVKHEGAE